MASSAFNLGGGKEFVAFGDNYSILPYVRFNIASTSTTNLYNNAGTYVTTSVLNSSNGESDAMKITAKVSCVIKWLDGSIINLAAGQSKTTSYYTGGGPYYVYILKDLDPSKTWLRGFGAQ